jgi:hypothetical protein
MPPDPDQLTLFCPRCCGALVIVTQVANHDGELVAVPAPCPACRPRPAAHETWLAAVKLGRRLARDAQPRVAPSGQMTSTGTPRCRA